MPWILAAVLVGVIVAMIQGFWHDERQALVNAEIGRERGRLWGLTCGATHRAVQAGLVTSARQVTPGELRSPPAPFRPFLPDGVNAADVAGAVTARYGAILADGVPLAACALTGADIGTRGPVLREGAAMTGLDQIAFVGGDDTPMHHRASAVEAVLGPLGTGSLFVTADFGFGHASERVHRRAVGGRPELSTLAQDVMFAGGAGITGAGRVGSGRAEADNGTMPEETGRAEVRGDVVVGASGRLTVRPPSPGQEQTAMQADGGFAFGGGAQTAFSIPQGLAVGASLRSRGDAAARDLALAGGLDADGELQARADIRAAGLVLENGLSASRATVSGILVVGHPPCAGCDALPLGGN